MERKINTDATGNTVWGSPAQASKRVSAHTCKWSVFDGGCWRLQCRRCVALWIRRKGKRVWCVTAAFLQSHLEH